MAAHMYAYHLVADVVLIHQLRVQTVLAFVAAFHGVCTSLQVISMNSVLVDAQCPHTRCPWCCSLLVVYPGRREVWLLVGVHIDVFGLECST